MPPEIDRKQNAVGRALANRDPHRRGALAALEHAKPLGGRNIAELPRLRVDRKNPQPLG